MARYLASVSAVALTLMLSHVSLAQTYRDSGGTVVQGIVPVGGNQSGPLFTPSNPGSVTGTFSASFAGFTPTPSYSYQSVTTSSAPYALPTGTVAVFYNTGSTAITVKLGSSSVTVVAGQGDVIQPDSWMAFTVGSATYYAVVGNGGTSSVVASGGAGLPTGAGGGGSGSGSGTMTQGSPNTVANAWPFAPVVSGSAVSSTNPLPIQGVSGGTAVPVAGTFWQTTQPVSLASLPALAAGSNTIGAISNTSFGISGTLPAFASTPTVTVGNSSIAVTGTFWQTTQPVSLASLPALAAGSNTIGAISNTSFAATQSGTWNVGLSAGSNTIGKADILGNAGATLDSAAGTANTEALTIQGNASGIAVPTSLASLPALAAGSNTIGSINNISGTVSLPTGAAIASNQTDVQSAPGTPQTTAITIQGNASGIPVPITGTITTTPGTVATPDVTGYSNGGTATTDTGDSYGRYMEIKAGSNAAQLLGGNAHIVGATGVTLDSAAGTAIGQALTIQGNAGGVAVPVSLASFPALAAGSAIIGKADMLGNSGATLDSAVGTVNSQALTTQGGGAGAVVTPVILPPQTTGGWLSDVLASLITPVVVKSSAGLVSAIQCDNLAGASNAYAQILNTATSPALGTNVIAYIPLAAGTSGGKVYPLPGLAASTGISVGIATTPTGSTAAGTAGNCEVDYE